MKNDKWPVPVIALAGVVLHLVFAGNMEFHRDELLYFSQAGHPSFGYYSVPPLTAWLALISSEIFGFTVFAARFLPAIAGGLTVWLAAMTAKEMSGKAFAQILAATGVTCSILFLRAFYLFQPVPFDIFFWTLSLFLIVRYLNRREPKYLVMLGVTLGIGLLNKYNLAFLLIAFLMVIPFTGMRRDLVSKHFLIAALTALILFLPNLIWQIVHGMPVIRHMKELTDTQLVNMSPGLFLKEQLMMVMPSTIIAVPGLFFLFFMKELKRWRMTGFICIVVLLIFILMRGKSYYAGGIYPFLTAAGAVGFESLVLNRYVRIAIPALLAAFTWFILPLGIPVFTPGSMVRYFDNFERRTGTDAIRRDEDNRYNLLPQDYSDMLGWEELVQITAREWKKIEDKDAALIFAENYGQAGAISVIGRRYGLPEPVSFSESFAYWIPEKFNKEITHVIYINDGEPGEDVYGMFREVILIERISNPLAREYGTGVYLCTGPRSSVISLLKAGS